MLPGKNRSFRPLPYYIQIAIPIRPTGAEQASNQTPLLPTDLTGWPSTKSSGTRRKWIMTFRLTNRQIPPEADRQQIINPPKADKLPINTYPKDLSG
jgi:hypothetical protein